ncbi:glycoside hydrolase [Auricularia subglabra TFB-10046 SS5]|nr:glycoside hydrolase [Auricularia subglabra TFB-10046 SS5]
MSFLSVSGDKIVDGNGKQVILRGAGLGGWMNMENFISGYPGREYQIRAALARVLGKDKSDFFFDKFLEYFFTEADAQFYKSLGLNAIRIAFNYRHFEDDLNPRVLKPEGFKHLDRVISLCAQQGIYTILDLHTAPGGQNCDWHSDQPTHAALFWEHKDFQDRTVWLWTELAKHYKDNAWVAGYNVLNEPTDPSHTQLITVYDRLHDAIRAHDTKHILFWDGNTFASDFSHFGDAHKRWTNSAYSIHDYSVFGFPDAPAKYEGTPDQARRLRRSFEKKMEWMKEQGLAVWNGEWGPVYARKEVEGDKMDEINEVRFRVLKDQLGLYEEAKVGWSIWLYKDIGFQGMTYVSPDTPYMKLLAPFLARKQKLAIDAWGADDSTPEIRAAYGPLEKFVEDNIDANYRDLYPHPLWPWKIRVARLARSILVAEFMVDEWADYFRGKTEEELDAIAASFKFENCLKRDTLNAILTANARSSAE